MESKGLNQSIRGKYIYLSKSMTDYTVGDIRFDIIDSNDFLEFTISIHQLDHAQ
jgi:hypothetical protein